MVSENYALPIRVLAFLLICLVLFYSCIVPVHASALLYEVLAATARSMVASLIRACGVYVADGVESEISSGLQSFEALTDLVLTYVWERLPDNLKMVNTLGQLMVKMVLKNGVYYAPRTLVELVCDGISANVTLDVEIGENFDFATYLGFLPRTDDDLQTFNFLLNGTAFKVLQDDGTYDWSFKSLTHNYCYYIKFEPTTETKLSSPYLLFSEYKNVAVQLDGDYIVVAIQPNTKYAYIYFSSVKNSITSKLNGFSSDTEYIYIPANSLSFYVIERQEASTPSPALSGLSFEDDVATIDSTWSAKGISVDDDKLDNAAVSMIPVSVYEPSSAATASKSEVTAGTVVDADTETVTDSVSDTVTDSTTQTGFWSSVLSLLNNILTAVKSLIGGITTPIVRSLSQVIAAVQSVAVAITDFFTPKFEDPDFYKIDLTNFFPFCIPFDLYDMLAAFVAEPEAPVFTFATGFLGKVFTVDIDLSPWDSVAKTVRTIQLCICIVGLAFATRKFIKW